MEKNDFKMQTILPLFGLSVEKELILHIDLNKFIKSQNENSPDRAPLIICRFLPWNNEQHADNLSTLQQYIPNIELPQGFDQFDNLGDIAFSTPGRIDSFTYQAPIESHQIASCVLVIDYVQETPHQLVMMMPGFNSCDDLFIEPLLIAIRIIVGGEPYPYKGFRIWFDNLDSHIIKWPIMDIKYGSVLMNQQQLEFIQHHGFEHFFYLRNSIAEKTGSRIFTRALGYYHLASSIRDTRTAFMLHMIAFETLFKKNQSENSNKAAKRMSYFLANDMTEKKSIYALIDGKPGWIQRRNAIVHGDADHIDHEIVDEIRNFLRMSLGKMVIFLFSLSDAENYHRELDLLTEEIEKQFMKKR